MSRVKTPLNLESVIAGRLKSVLISQPEGLDGICSLLNGSVLLELRLSLRKLVEAWHSSGPNLNKLLEKDRDLAAHLKHGRTILVPTNTGKGHLLWLPGSGNLGLSSGMEQALPHFMDLIVNPHWQKLGGPCYRCGKYYVKKTSRQKTYCSRRCGSWTTAVATTRKKREVERAQKVSRAQAAANDWALVRTRLSWKEWVSARTLITVKWLTRAFNRGDLRAPVKDRALTS